jgi:hypothetical protein
MTNTVNQLPYNVLKVLIMCAISVTLQAHTGERLSIPLTGGVAAAVGGGGGLAAPTCKTKTWEHIT